MASQAAQAAAVGTLVDAQTQSVGNLTKMAANLAAQAAQSFNRWYDHASIAQWAFNLAQLIEAIQSNTAASTDAYLTEALGQMTGRSVSPAGTINVAGLRKGADHTEVYGRVADTYRYQISLGKPDDEALRIATQRAQAIADTDVALAGRAQAQSFMEQKHAHWRRIIHPELSAGGTCGLCIAASDRVYTASDLMPLHDRCHCTVLPIVGENDPGQTLNRQDLDALYKQAGGTDRTKLKAVRFTVHQHGELGPILAKHGNEFRGPSDLPAAA